jgi:hypothetical protein
MYRRRFIGLMLEQPCRTRIFFGVFSFRESMFSGFALTEQDSRVGKDNYFLCRWSHIFLSRSHFSCCDETISLRSFAKFSDIYREADDPG